MIDAKSSVSTRYRSTVLNNKTGFVLYRTVVLEFRFQSLDRFVE